MNLLPELAGNFALRHPDETAQLLERMPLDNIREFLQSLDGRSAANVLNQMLPAVAGPILLELQTVFRNEVLQQLSHRAAAAMIRAVEPDQQKVILEQMSGDLSRVLRPLLSYPADTAGAHMDPRVAAWPVDMKASEAMDGMRTMKQHMVDYMYIVNRENELVGVMSYWELAGAARDRTLGSLMHPHVDRLLATAPKQSILVQPAWRRFHSMPVTDETGHFVGVLRYKTLRHMEGETIPELQNPVHTFLALGELCWTGMTAVWDAMTSVTTPIGRSERDL